MGEVIYCDYASFISRGDFFFLLTIGTVLIKSNSGQLMLVSPQQAVTRAETTSNITSRPAVQANAQTVKFCTMPVIYLKVFSSSFVFQLLSYKCVCIHQ